MKTFKKLSGPANEFAASSKNFALLVLLTLIATISSHAAAPAPLVVEVRDIQNALPEQVFSVPLDLRELKEVGAIANDATPANIEVWERGETGQARRVVAEFAAPATGKSTPAWSTPSALLWLAEGPTKIGARRQFEIRMGSAPAGSTPEPRLRASLAPVMVEETADKIIVANKWHRVTHDKKRGGAVSEITFVQSGTRVPVIMQDNMNNREGEAGQLRLEYDTAPQITVSKGALQTVVEIKARYLPLGGKREEGVDAIYRYTYSAATPLIGVEIQLPQQAIKAPMITMEMLKFIVTPTPFKSWMMGEPLVTKTFEKAGESAAMGSSLGVSSQWGMIADEQNALGVIGPRLGGFYYGGNYHQLVTTGRSPWRGAPWLGEGEAWSGQLYLGPAQSAVEYARGTKNFRLALRVPALEERLEAARKNQANAGNTTAQAASAMMLDSAQARIEAGRELKLAQELISDAAKIKTQAAPLVLETSSFLVLANAHTGLLFKTAGESASLDSIYHNQNRHAFLKPALEPRPLWQAQLKDSGGQWKQVDSTTAKLSRLTISHPDPQTTRVSFQWQAALEAGSTLATNVEVTLNQNDPLARWRIQTAPAGRTFGLWTVQFPIIEGMSKESDGGDDFLVGPSKSGLLLSDPANGSEYDQDYPGQASMQFVPYWQRPKSGDAQNSSGLFTATYDGEGFLKYFRVEPQGDETFALKVRHPVENMGKPGNSFSTPYDCVIGAFDGDWYDAAKLYRAWALKQRWARKQPLSANKDVPQWFKDANMVFRPGGEPQAVVRAMKDFKTELGGGPANIGWYEWILPDLFQNNPEVNAKPGYREAVEELKKEKMFVTAYIEAMLWDTNSASYKSENAAEKVMVREADGKVRIAAYGGFPLGAACPATTLWQDKMSRVITQVLDAGDAYGVYADLLGTGSGALCMASNHGHPVGGGKHYIEGTRKLAKAMRETARKREPNFVLQMEGNAECFMDVVDSYLLFQGVDASLSPVNVPMFQAVYADYFRPYGSKGASISNPPIEALLMAQMFVFGCPNGRIFWYEETTKDPNWAKSLYFQHSKKLAAYRQAALPYLAYGEMLRPLEIKTSVDKPHALHEKGLAIQTATWRAPGKSVAFVLTNATFDGDPTTVSYRIDPKEYGIPTDGSFALYNLSPDGKTQEQIITGPFERKDVLAPLGVLILTMQKKAQ